MSKELKPCPFCGGKAKLCSREVKQMQILEDTIKFHNVICERCGAMAGVFYATEDEAVAAWNHRDPKPAVRGELLNEHHRVAFCHECSVCGAAIPWSSVWDYKNIGGNGDFNFCPNCGADLRKEKDNESSDRL